MRAISAVWRIGLPTIVVASSVLVLVAAVRSRGGPATVSRAVAVLAALVWLRLVGVAAFGDQHPVVERLWNGAAAALLALAAAVHLWRWYHRWNLAASAPVSAASDPPTLVASAPLAAWHQVTMPALGEDVVEATVTRWLKQVGDRIEVGEPLVEISTDKVDTEVPADAFGDLREIRVPVGTTVPVGSIIAVIEPPAVTS